MRQRIRSFRFLLIVLVVVAALTTVGGWLLVRPVTDPPGQVDVVLVLAGGRGERQITGVRLARKSVAPVLVFSDGGRPDSSSGTLCRQRLAGVRVLCLTPRTDTTRGEARAFAELAAREGWRSVALVTTGLHSRRASLLVGRCFPGTIHTVAAAPVGVDGRDLVLFAARESAAMLVALTAQRGC
jgi:uncharacterized SAM-binding protein YcdF (DUF218 family)